MKTWGSGGIAPPFLNSVLDGGEGSASRPGRLTPREIAAVTYSIGGWVGPRARLNAAEKIKILAWLKSNAGRPARSPSLYRLSYPDTFP
jgi:hypothetical protein